jgi:ribosomal protein L20A (L18A)
VIGIPEFERILRGGCGEIRTKRSLNEKNILEMFTWEFGSRDKVKCEVSLMKDEE